MAHNLTKKKEKKSILSRFAVAIVDPEFGTNVGYLARTMANFGMETLFIVSSKKLDRENLSKANLFASHGRWIVDKLVYVDSIESLKKKYKTLIGTTAIESRRKSNLTRMTLGLEECATTVVSRLSPRKSACFVFGRDTTGLTNEELKACDYTLTIRTQSSYNTLNISHAAAIIFYVFSNPRIKGESGRNSDVLGSSGGNKLLPSRKEKNRAVLLFQKLAEEAELPSFKSELLKETLQRMFNRGDPSLREIYLLMGLASKSTSKIRRLSKDKITP